MIDLFKKIYASVVCCRKKAFFPRPWKVGLKTVTLVVKFHKI